jgi:hypothetical protein
VIYEGITLAGVLNFEIGRIFETVGSSELR